MKPSPAIFEEHHIRRLYDEENEIWFFSVIDIVQVLIEQSDYKKAQNYWGQLKVRLKKEGSQVVDDISLQKLLSTDGKRYRTDVATAETILRLVQSIPSPRAEPIKLWLAKVGQERLQELSNPELAVDRAVDTWKRQGRPEKWIEQRMRGQETRKNLTDHWQTHEVEQGRDFARLTNEIHKEWSDVSIRDHKQIKDLKPSQNLRDHMTPAELVFTELAELSTVEIARQKNATGVDENSAAGKEGGAIARRARLDFEKRTKTKVVSSFNFLPGEEQAKLEDGQGGEEKKIKSVQGKKKNKPANAMR